MLDLPAPRGANHALLLRAARLGIGLVLGFQSGLGSGYPDRVRARDDLTLTLTLTLTSSIAPDARSMLACLRLAQLLIADKGSSPGRSLLVLTRAAQVS